MNKNLIQGSLDPKFNLECKTDSCTAKNAQIIDYTDGVLTIKAKNPSWKNELIFFVEEIKKNFRQKKIK